MNEEIKQLKQMADIARVEYRTGNISRGQAKERIMPYIDAVNEHSKELAKKYNQRPRFVSFNTFVR